MHYRLISLAIILALISTCGAAAQQTATSGTFALYKFAKELGTETYSIESKGETYTLSSHFLFTDRGRKVPLETTLVAATAGMTPRSYAAKGQASRMSNMDDTLTVNGNSISITRSGKAETLTVSEPWFITDGYSPVAMQEQMMRWWLTHGQPAAFTVYPSKATVHILPAGPLPVGGVAAHGYTVSGLIWGQESLWVDDSQNLIALVSTDAEFDHFEAVRQPYQPSLGSVYFCCGAGGSCRVGQADRGGAHGSGAAAGDHRRDARGFHRRSPRLRTA